MHYISFKNLNKKQYLEIFKYCFLFKKKTIKLKNINVGILFLLPSTRTKSSFLISCKKMGINIIDILIKDTQQNRGEKKADTYKIFSLYFDIIITRGIKNYKLFSNKIINALDYNEHPTQIINDLFTIIELKGKIDVNITWVGRCNNVFKSLYYAYKIFNFNLKVFSIKKEIKNFKIKNQKNIYKACKNADFVMTDTWNSMGEKKKKKYKKLKIKKKYINKSTYFMHCLPLYRGKEIEKNVLKNENCIIWKQAKNKIISSQAILYFFLKIK
ncbi:hypothetical protein [Candidatus Vidania fulgoroideorum]